MAPTASATPAKAPVDTISDPAATVKKTKKSKAKKKASPKDQANESGDKVISGGDSSKASVTEAKPKEAPAESKPAEAAESVVVAPAAPSEELSVAEYLERRRKNLSKRKTRIDALLGSDPATLNADQKNSLNRKEAIDSALHEVEEAERVYGNQIKRDERTAEEGAATVKESHEKEIAEINNVHQQALRKQQSEHSKKIDGLKKAHEAQLALTVRFLRLASLLRTEGVRYKEFSPVVEQVLATVYGGDDASVEALHSLNRGDSEAVEGENTITFAQLKELALKPMEALFEPEEEEQQPKTVQFRNGELRPNGGMTMNTEISFFADDSEEEEEDDEDDIEVVIASPPTPPSSKQQQHPAGANGSSKNSSKKNKRKK